MPLEKQERTEDKTRIRNDTREDGHPLPLWKEGEGGHNLLLQKKGEESIKEKHKSVAGHPSPL